MKKPPDDPTFQRFTAAMQAIMKVPKTAVTKRAGAGKKTKSGE